MNNRKGSGRPARNYSWEQFPPGHELSVKSGAQSERKIAEVFPEHLERILANGPPWLGDPSFRGEVEALARAESISTLLWRYLDTNGPLDGEGKVRPAGEFYLRADRRAGEIRRNLGLNPMARIQLEAARAATVRDSSLADQLAEGRRIRLAHESSSIAAGAAPGVVERRNPPPATEPPKNAENAVSSTEPAGSGPESFSPEFSSEPPRAEPRDSRAQNPEPPESFSENETPAEQRTLSPDYDEKTEEDESARVVGPESENLNG